MKDNGPKTTGKPRGLDSRLVRIAKWRNEATASESIWESYIRAWFNHNILDELEMVKQAERHFIRDLKSGEIFNIITEEPTTPAKRITDFVDPLTGRRFSEPQGWQEVAANTVGPALVQGVFVNDPPIATKSRRNLTEVLGVIFELRMEGVLDKNFQSPKLKQCHECTRWFVCRKTDQIYCSGDCREAALRGRPEDKDSSDPKLRKRRERYLEIQKRRMEELRSGKKRKPHPGLNPL